MPARTTALATLVFLGAPAPAPAQSPPPPPPVTGAAAVAQYRESLPTGSGPAAPGVGSRRVTPLPPPLAERIDAKGGADAPLLKKLATSSDYGAPQTGVRVAGEPAKGRVAAPVAAVDEPSLRAAPAAALDALRAGASGRLGLLGALLLGVTLAVAATSRARGR